MKRCYKCGIKYPRTLEYFSMQRANTDGLKGLCKSCQSIQSRKYRRKPKPEHIRNSYKKHFDDKLKGVGVYAKHDLLEMKELLSSNFIFRGMGENGASELLLKLGAYLNELEEYDHLPIKDRIIMNQLERDLSNREVSAVADAIGISIDDIDNVRLGKSPILNKIIEYYG